MVPSTPVPASTVVLIRPAHGALEVFLVRRHDRVAFMAGAHVFPGGRVDPDDDAADARAWCDGIDETAARTPGRETRTAVAFAVAAVRELFEEAGVLMARDASGQILRIDTDNEQRFLEHRRAMIDRRLTLRELALTERLRIALDRLSLFANWVTPAIEPRRFDTMFYLAIAPAEQHALHDEHEATHGDWIGAAGAIEQCAAGEIALPPPTWTTLRQLARLPSVDDAWRWAQSQSVPRVEPCFAERGDGTRFVMLPGDPECPSVDGFEAQETRFLLAGGRWTPVASGEPAGADGE